ncbi:MAG: VWA domain-containing protein [Nannocystaceae bacterium]|nr:VWA domain-containing protein [Nannocystaceae bacterium]
MLVELEIRSVGWVVLAASMVACGGDEPREDGGLSQSASISFTAGSADVSGGDSDPSGDASESSGDNTGSSPTGASAGDEGGVNGCEELVDEADLGPRPQDIIFAVDTSASMIQEAAFVQQHMNSFSVQIDAAQVDARIILLSDYSFLISPGVCIDPPLGSGGCPNMDSNPPDFLHVPDSGVGSSDGLLRLIELYPGYSPLLRPNALTHVVVVTDDDSSLSAADFTDQFSALSEHLGNFVFHGIVSSLDPDGPACGSCCALGASQGTVYQELITLTGGVEGNLCDQEFQPVFAAVAQQVIGGASLACSYQIPDPPDGEAFDRDEVNVEFEDSNGMVLPIGRVESEAACAGVAQGWYYDDPIDPSRIIVCPQTCDTIRGFEAGQVAIKFGCETIPAA